MISKVVIINIPNLPYIFYNPNPLILSPSINIFLLIYSTSINIIPKTNPVSNQTRTITNPASNQARSIGVDDLPLENYPNRKMDLLD